MEVHKRRRVASSREDTWRAGWEAGKEIDSLEATADKAWGTENDKDQPREHKTDADDDVHVIGGR